MGKKTVLGSRGIGLTALLFMLLAGLVFISCDGRSAAAALVIRAAAVSQEWNL